MKVTEATKDISSIMRNPRRDTSYWRILKFFEEHPDEIYRKRDVAKELVLNYNTVKEVVRQLYSKKHIDKYLVKEATPKFSYYGVPSAINQLRDALKSKGE